MARKGGGRPPRKRGGTGGGSGPGAGGGKGGGRPGGRSARPARGGKKFGGPAGAKRGPKRGAGPRSAYFTQPGRNGATIVLRRPIGNRASPKVCGVMPSRIHAKMLMDQLIRAEGAVKDLFLEATDDGIEALEAVLAANREDVLRRGPKYDQAVHGSEGMGTAEDRASGGSEPSGDDDDADEDASDEGETGAPDPE